jgi:hypothetical protein
LEELQSEFSKLPPSYLAEEDHAQTDKTIIDLKEQAEQARNELAETSKTFQEATYPSSLLDLIDLRVRIESNEASEYLLGPF